MTDAQAAAPGVSARRRMTFRVLTIVLGVAAGIGAFALVALVASWFIGGDRDVHRIHDLGWGALGGLLLALPLILQGWRPEQRVAATQQFSLVILVAVVAAAISDGLDAFILPFVGAAILLVAIHPARRALVEPGAGLSPLLAVLAVAAAVPLVIYALDQAEIGRACPPAGDEHCEEGHWTTMVALALAIPLTGLLAAFRTPGWRIPAWTAGGAAAVLGLSSLLFDRLSALDTGWAVVALVGGPVFIAAAEWVARRPAPPPT